MRLFHYYGDSVRLLLLAGGFIMLITLPMFNALLPISTLISLSLIALLVLSAGLTNPLNMKSATLDVSISGVALVTFGYSAVASYAFRNTAGSDGWFFWVNLILATIFFFSFYLSLKTVRGFRQGSMVEYPD